MTSTRVGSIAAGGSDSVPMPNARASEECDRSSVSVGVVKGVQTLREPPTACVRFGTLTLGGARPPGRSVCELGGPLLEECRDCLGRRLAERGHDLLAVLVFHGSLDRGDLECAPHALLGQAGPPRAPCGA